MSENRKIDEGEISINSIGPRQPSPAPSAQTTPNTAPATGKEGSEEKK